MGPTRREFLTLLGVSAVGCGRNADGPDADARTDAGADADVDAAVDAATDAPPAGARAVITPDDLRFLGYYRFPTEGLSDLAFAGGGFTLRRVGDEVRVLLVGNIVDNSPLHELVLPLDPPGPIATAPVMTLHRNWGDIRAGHVLTAANTGNDSSLPSSMFWDAQRNALWWNYGDVYVPSHVFPNLSCTILDDRKGTFQSFGPWRVQPAPGGFSTQMVQGALSPIPSAFADAHTSGNDFGFSGFMSSGVAGCPYGPNLYAGRLFDPTVTPPDGLDDGHATVVAQQLIHHDLQHRMTRDTRSATCGWKVAYDCTQGDVLIPDDGSWGGTLGTTTDDNCSLSAWIDLPDKHGVVYLGTLVRSPDGYVAPGDPEGRAHRWYGDPFVQKPLQTCCHGQDDPNWRSTGDGAHYRQPMGWIYDPDALIAVAEGAVQPWDVLPSTDAFEMRTLSPDFDRRLVFERLGGGYFDAPTRRLYVAYWFDTFTRPGFNLPALAVFEIA